MGNFIDCLSDNSRLNLMYTVIILATADRIRLNGSSELRSYYYNIIMNIDSQPTDYSSDSRTNDSHISEAIMTGLEEEQKPCLLIRLARRLAHYSDRILIYIQNQVNEHTTASIASFSVLIIVVSIIFCFIMSLMREEERRLREQYEKLNTGSSQSFVAIGGGGKLISGRASFPSSSPNGAESSGKSSSSSSHHRFQSHQSRNPLSGHFQSHRYTNISSSVNRLESHKLHIVELRRETYFGLVRLSKPGCRTMVLLCDAQSKLKLLARFYQCIYPYRKNKTLQFAFLLIEKNIGWYRELLKLALNEKRDLDINPMNCIGTVLVLNGFKKYFSVYHASDSNFEAEEPFVLLEESLLDNLSGWLERLFAGRASIYYVKYWPGQMR